LFCVVVTGVPIGGVVRIDEIPAGLSYRSSRFLQLAPPPRPATGRDEQAHAAAGGQRTNGREPNPGSRTRIFANDLALMLSARVSRRGSRRLAAATTEWRKIQA